MYIVVKRVIDFVLSFIALIMLIPLFLIVAIAIKIDSKGPVIFKQKRVGIHKTYFTMCKFRTMQTTAPTDTPTHMLDNSQQYISRVGSLLRRFSIDETLQFYHVLVGNMSIIGPRPALYNQCNLISERDKYGANDVKPGLTGYAQIYGRDMLSIDEKARLDGVYAQNISFWLDVKLFFLTIPYVLKCNGVVEGGISAIKTTREVEKVELK